MERYRVWIARALALVLFAFLSTVLHPHPSLKQSESVAQVVNGTKMYAITDNPYPATWILLEFLQTLIVLSVFVGIYWIIYRVILRLLGDHRPPPGQLLQVNSLSSLILGAFLGIIVFYVFQDHQRTTQEEVNQWDAASRIMTISYLYETGNTQLARDRVGFNLGQLNDFMLSDDMKRREGKEIAGFYMTLNQPVPSTFFRKNPLPTDASAADFVFWKNEALGKGPFESAAPPATAH